MSDRHEQAAYVKGARGQGQTRSGKFVCAPCLEDKELQRFTLKQGKSHHCDYCGKASTTPNVVPLDDVIEFMRTAIEEEWRDPAEDAPTSSSEDDWSSEEDYYQVETLDSDELLYEIGFDVSNKTIMSDISLAFANHRWCRRYWERLPRSKRWSYGWDRFQHVVKHERRYTFWYSRDDWEEVSDPGSLPPADMLGEIGGVINRTKLVKLFPVGTLAWRLRVHEKNEALSAPEEFTSPPIEAAIQPNRMSPGGVPMFYGADDFHTAQLELVESTDSGKLVSGAQFENIVPINLLDLTLIPPLPSYFSSGGPVTRHAIDFLRKFVEDLSQPIKRDNRQHIEYVPTQVFTEYVRHVMKTTLGARAHGIRYLSSKNAKPCSVIFATQDECLPEQHPLDMKPPQILRFIPGSVKTVEIA